MPGLTSTVFWGRKTERKRWPLASPNTASGIAPLLRFGMRGRAKQLRPEGVEGVRQFHQILKGRVSQRTLNSCEVGSVHLTCRGVCRNEKGDMRNENRVNRIGEAIAGHFSTGGARRAVGSRLMST